MMDTLQIHNILKRLGFFYVREEDRGPSIDFLAGHVACSPFLVLTLTKGSSELAGPYAELVNRLCSVLSRYKAESDHFVMLPFAMRQAWMADLAHEAGLSLSELRAVTSSTVE